MRYSSDENIIIGMSFGVQFEEYHYVVGDTSYGTVTARLTSPVPVIADDFFERSVLVLGAMGVTEKAARSLLEQMRLKVKSERRLEQYKECVGGLRVTLLPYKLDDEGELTAAIIGVDFDSLSDKCESKPIKSKNRVIAQWSGKSIKSTETFNVTTHEWKISWDTRPGDYIDMNFQILVYNADGTPYWQQFVAANVIGADTDSSVMRGSGRYYLTINSAQSYEITVEEMP